MKNVGIKEDEYYGHGPVGVKIKPGQRIIFPSIDLKGSQLTAMGLDDCEVGDKYTGTVEVVVRSLRSNVDDAKNINKGATVEITAANPFKESGSADDKKPGKDDASVEAAKKKKAPRPKTSNENIATDLSPADTGLDMGDD